MSNDKPLSYGELLDLWDRGLCTYDEVWDQLRDEHRVMFNKHIAVNQRKRMRELAGKAHIELQAMADAHNNLGVRLHRAYVERHMEGILECMETITKIAQSKAICLWPRETVELTPNSTPRT